MTPINFENDDLPEPPRGVVDYLKRLDGRADPEFERRQDARRPILTKITAVPVNEEEEPVGEAFKAVSHDLSKGGMALLHTRALNVKYLAVEIAPEPETRIRLLIEIVECRSVGPFYEIHGKFVKKLQS